MGGGRTHGSRSRTAKAKKALAGANANDKKKAIKGLKVPYRPPEKTAHKKDMMIQWRFPSVVMSVRDKNPWLDLSKDHLEISGTHGGFKTARASHGVHKGTFYWECEICECKPAFKGEEANVRLGWSTRKGDLNGPVGVDAYGWGYRDLSGSKTHKGVRDDNYGESYGPGDIIGCWLHLNHENIQENEMRFYKNGKDQGVAFKGNQLPKGVYFPTISIHMYARVKVNFGPSFILIHGLNGGMAFSEVAPMNPEERRVHENRIMEIRENSDVFARLHPDIPSNSHLFLMQAEIQGLFQPGVGIAEKATLNINPPKQNLDHIQLKKGEALG